MYMYLMMYASTCTSCYILYPLMQRNHQFANSDVPFQNVTNDLLCTTNLQCKYIRWMLHLNCYTHGGLRMLRVITKQLMYGSSCNICRHELPAKQNTRPNPLLHTEPYINYNYMCHCPQLSILISKPLFISWKPILNSFIISKVMLSAT